MRWFVLAIVCLGTLVACGSKPPAEEPKSGGSQGDAAAQTGGGDAAPQGGGGGEEKKLPETLPLSGTFTNEQIQTAVNNNISAFDACYTLGADKTGKRSGTVTIQATVGPNGDVFQSEVTKSTVKNTKVDACVAGAFKKVKFPRPEGGGTVMITYQMNFSGEVVTKN